MSVGVWWVKRVQVREKGKKKKRSNQSKNKQTKTNTIECFLWISELPLAVSTDIQTAAEGCAVWGIRESKLS